MKRGKAEPELEDVTVCVSMGWTLTELHEQPSEFIDRLRVYLWAVSEQQNRDSRQAQEDLDSKLRRIRM